MKGSLGRWLDFVEKSLSAESFELAKTLKDGSASSEVRLVAVLLLLSASDSISVEDQFYANVSLLTTIFYESWQKGTEEIVALIISRAWLEIAEGQRFSVRAPAITAEPIIAACNEKFYQGLRKAAKMLLAVKDAVWTSISEDVLSSLKEKAS